MDHLHSLFRADSWAFQGAGPNALLKTVSDVLQQAALKMEPAHLGPAQANHLANEHRASNSTDSTSTAHEAAVQRQQADMVAPILSPLRQISLDAIAATAVLGRPMPERQNLFQDVLEQLSAKDDGLLGGSGLYTMPSSVFLENLLQEMDSKSTRAGQRPSEPPLYLPLDTFDLPGDQEVRGLVPTPFDVLAQRSQQYHPGLVRKAGAPRGLAGAPRGAGPPPSARRGGEACTEVDEYDEPEVSIQTSKSGRVRKVASFTGVKRKQDHGAAPMHTSGSAPSIMAAAPAGGSAYAAAQQQHDGSDSDGDCSALSEVSRGGSKPAAARKPAAKGMSRKGKRTVCLNCGCHQTPQWRCGPLGPRTLCNACGVRCKKGLPLNCWPLREGMVLPPGAVLPPDVHVPAGMTIILQPAESE